MPECKLGKSSLYQGTLPPVSLRPSPRYPGSGHFFNDASIFFGNGPGPGDFIQRHAPVIGLFFKICQDRGHGLFSHRDNLPVCGMRRDCFRFGGVERFLLPPCCQCRKSPGEVLRALGRGFGLSFIGYRVFLSGCPVLELTAQTFVAGPSVSIDYAQNSSPGVEGDVATSGGSASAPGSGGTVLKGSSFMVEVVQLRHIIVDDRSIMAFGAIRQR
jgi:hypothetical protein